MEVNISPIKKHEAHLVAETFFYAFKDDPLMKWLFVDRQNYEKHARAAYETWIKYTILYGMTFKTPTCESIAIYKKPNDVEFSLWRVLRSGLIKNPKILGKEGFARLEQLGKVLREHSKRYMVDKAFWYCWMIGAHPDKQNQGFGSAIFSAANQAIDSSGLPSYLEASTKDSQRLYERQGFKTLGEIQIPDSDVVLYAMERPAS